MSNNGYVKMHRSLMDKGYYLKSEYVHLWLHLIYKATYTQREFMFNGNIEILQPGQFITSRSKLSIETGIEESKIERILNAFKTEQQIEQQSRNKFRIISILNWNEYQNIEQQNEPGMNSKRTASEQQVNTNNKENKEKKIKKEIMVPEWISKDSLDAFTEMRKKIKKPLTDKAIEMLFVKLAGFKDKGYDPNEILNESTMNSWQGVFEPKTKPTRQLFQSVSEHNAGVIGRALERAGEI